MHEGEIIVTPELVRTLVDEQFPQWALLPLIPIDSAGTDNALYRLGDAMTVRLPRIHWAAGQPAKEYRWLPYLAPRVPLEIPVPLALGEPAHGYPYQWSIVRWLSGSNARSAPFDDPRLAAADLAEFVRALQIVETPNGPPPAEFNAGRGVPLIQRDAGVQKSLAQLRALEHSPIDIEGAAHCWQDALDAPVHSGAPVWLHGDLHATNVLVRAGRLSAVIDFGCLGMGDPAVELLPAWYLFDAPARDLYRERLGVDDACWRRGRGWAVSMALMAIPYYLQRNPTLVDMSVRAIEDLLGET